MIEMHRLIREITRWEMYLQRAVQLTQWLAAWLAAQPRNDPRHAFGRVICIATYASRYVFRRAPGDTWLILATITNTEKVPGDAERTPLRSKGDAMTTGCLIEFGSNKKAPG